jgi:hypothetical protein
MALQNLLYTQALYLDSQNGPKVMSHRYNNADEKQIQQKKLQFFILTSYEIRSKLSDWYQ